MHRVIFYHLVCIGLLSCCSLGGVPSTGGDFVGPTGAAGQFAFSSTENRPCIDIFIFGDELFEGEEEFDVEFQFFMLDDGSTVSSVAGVTVDPRRATVIIEDSNSTLWCA